jgi:hypothetical protein
VISKKNKHINHNNNSSQVVLDNFFSKMIDTQSDLLDGPPPRVEDNDDNYYNTQITNAPNTIPEGFLQEHKI